MSEDIAEFKGWHRKSKRGQEKLEVMLAQERGQRETKSEIDHQVGSCENWLECLDSALRTYRKCNFLSALTTTPGPTHLEITLVLTVRHDSALLWWRPVKFSVQFLRRNEQR